MHRTDRQSCCAMAARLRRQRRQRSIVTGPLGGSDNRIRIGTMISTQTVNLCSNSPVGTRWQSIASRRRDSQDNFRSAHLEPVISDFIHWSNAYSALPDHLRSPVTSALARFRLKVITRLDITCKNDGLTSIYHNHLATKMRVLFTQASQTAFQLSGTAAFKTHRINQRQKRFVRHFSGASMHILPACSQPDSACQPVQW